MTVRRAFRPLVCLAVLLLALSLLRPSVEVVATAAGVPSPEQFIGFAMGTDNKLARWDKIVDYMKAVASTSDRVRVRELGKTSQNNPLIALEISAPETLKNLDRYKQLERRLYFQNGTPSARDRDELFRQGKAVVLITCSTHAIEIGATQMALELVHHLATDNSSATKNILDNVVLLLVPSVNPDGQILVTDWFNRNVGTPYESSPIPYLYHPYVGHDSNRDMYMFTQKESQYMAQLVWHDWFPSVWLDQHQMSANGPRIFVMPATDPINLNVHPVIYRWNTILGQSQAAALETAGKDGIIYNSTYTNFWEGALAWSGWWHNQIGLLTEVASARIAAPVVQQMAVRRDLSGVEQRPTGDGPEPILSAAPLPPPTDTTPRTEYPRPWMGGKWTLRDIVDYEMISTLALLETTADRREAILRQIYEVNRQTIDEGRTASVKAIVIPADRQHDPREAAHLIEKLMIAGVEVYRADGTIDAEDTQFAAGSYVIPMTQVFARYAKDLLEKQTYPEIRKSPDTPADPPYDVTAWSLGMQFGVDVRFLTTPVTTKLTRLTQPIHIDGRVSGNGPRFVMNYDGPDTAIAINRLLKANAKLAYEAPSRVVVDGVSRDVMEPIAKEFGLDVVSTPPAPAGIAEPERQAIRAPRIGLYYPWTGDNTDEGWTRWVLEQYEFNYTTIHNADMRAGNLRRQFDAIILPDQNPREILDGLSLNTIRPEFRGGIGDAGLENLGRFVSQGGTLITLGAASDLAIDRFPIPVRNLKRSLRREQHFAPGTIVHIQVDPTQAMSAGVARDTYGFYNNSPFFTLLEGFNALRPTVIARFPNQDIVASGWLRGEDAMAGRPAVVSVDMKPGRVVLFGLRPQHRAQTHATFPLLFNALFLASDAAGPILTQ
ncbi:MAG: hypothetical protein LBQ09_02150 [Acidobacteriaceae bacterium]|nr:hypothetical protein [Acidobacteriaceae bacterium]